MEAPERILLCVRPKVSQLTGQALWYEDGSPVPYIGEKCDVLQVEYVRADRLREQEARIARLEARLHRRIGTE